MRIDAHELVGTWLLNEFAIETASGKHLHPFGSDGVGTLTYSKEGWVSAVLAKRDRGVAGEGGLEKAALASDKSKVAAFDSYMSYTGRYRVDGDIVEHELVSSLSPGLAGRTLARKVELSGGELVLRYEVAGHRGPAKYTLRWTKAKS